MILDDLRKLEAKATPGKCSAEDGTFCYMILPSGDSVMFDAGDTIERDLHVALRNAAPALIACAEALKLLHDNAEYVRINNLGGVESHYIHMAREALKHMEE